MIRLNDDKRSIKFSGSLLGEASSKTDTSLRWVEFKLYKTKGGQYILWRIGKSRVYHTIWCNKKLDFYPSNTVVFSDLIPCQKCQPSPDEEYVSPEMPRSKILTTKNAASVIKLLYMVDKDDIQYLTNVAIDLLNQSSENDKDIKDAYEEEYIY